MKLDKADTNIIDQVNFSNAWKVARRYLRRPEMIKEDDLPEAWDWRDVEGYDFTSPVRDQGGCGSCYVISFITSLESRVYIATGKLV